MKKPHLALFFSVATVSVCFSFAYAAVTQEGVGGSGGDVTSAGYRMKTAVADPAVGTSQSANYRYDHGTVWFDDGTAPPLPPVGGGGGGGSSGGGSGSGWFESFFGNNPQIGGVSPEADVPFTDTPVVGEAVRNMPRSTQAAIRVKDIAGAITRVLESPRPAPQIIRAVDDAGIVRELVIVLVKRIMPWLLWLALAFLLLGIALFVVYAFWRGASKVFLWLAGICIVCGIVIGFVARFIYRVTPPDMSVIVSSQTIQVGEVNGVMKKFIQDLPQGAHSVTATDTQGRSVLTIKVFITPALPF